MVNEPSTTIVEFQIGDTCPICERGTFNQLDDVFTFVYKDQVFSRKVKKLKCNFCHTSFLYRADEKLIDEEAAIFRRCIQEKMSSC